MARAGQEPDPATEQALDELLQLYRPALKTHLVLRKGLRPDRADDLLQGFVASKILRGRLLTAADPQRGKFRTYLLTALDRYIISVARHDAAQKRSPGEQPVLNLDEHPDAVAVTDRAAEVFDVAWAREVIASALGRVQAECAATGRDAYWQMFDRRIVGPLLEGLAPPPYEELVRQLGFASPTQASNALLTAKRMFARFLREVVAAYATDDAAVESELRELRAILAEAGAGSGPVLRNHGRPKHESA